MRGVPAARPLVKRFVKALDRILPDCQAFGSIGEFDSVAYTQPSDHPAPPQTLPERFVTHPGDRNATHQAAKAAFRDLHAQRLHGFALILTMGERQLAAHASNQALAEADRMLPELRHPERAAAWLRHRVLLAVRKTKEGARLSSAERFRALAELGIGLAAMVGLEALSVPERAALVASDVERLSPLDVEQVVGRSRNGTRRLVQSARRRFVAVAAEQVDVQQPAGPMSRRIEEVAARMVGPGLGR